MARSDSQALSAVRAFVDAGGTFNIRGQNTADGPSWQAQAVNDEVGSTSGNGSTFAKAVDAVLPVQPSEGDKA